MAKSSKRYTRYVLNCDPASTPEADWTYEDAVSAGLVADQAPLLVATVNFPFVTTQNFSLWACR